MQAIFMIYSSWTFISKSYQNFNQPNVMVNNIDLIFQSTTRIPIGLGSDLLKIESISGSYLLTYYYYLF